jgi:uncharacterized protein YndB with AHSA1/START domain
MWFAAIPRPLRGLAIMTTLQHEVLIHAPITEVWRVLADLEAVRHYNPMVSTARYVSERRDGIGATRMCEFKPGGSVKERVTEWTPNEAMAMEAFDHVWPMRDVRWRNELSRVDGATRVTQVLQYEFVGDPAVAATMASQWDQGVRAVFEGLKSHIEAAVAR